MTSMLQASKLFRFNKKRCTHGEPFSVIKPVRLSQRVKDVAGELHAEGDNDKIIVFVGNETTGTILEVGDTDTRFVDFVDYPLF